MHEQIELNFFLTPKCLSTKKEKKDFARVPYLRNQKKTGNPNAHSRKFFAEIKKSTSSIPIEKNLKIFGDI